MFQVHGCFDYSYSVIPQTVKRILHFMEKHVTLNKWIYYFLDLYNVKNNEFLTQLKQNFCKICNSARW